MYFLTSEERLYLSRKLLPEARKIDVHPELRGWHWSALDAPLRPTYVAPLAMWEIASGYCASGREVYLRNVLREEAPARPEMVEGAALHAFVAGYITAAKRLIYDTPPVALLDALPSLLDEPPAPDGAQAVSGPDLGGKCRALRRFETYKLIAMTQEVLARQPNIGQDALAAQVLPVVVEQKVDGSFLGLSAHLSVDAYHLQQPMVLDLKFGPREAFHRLSTAGYALALESVYEQAIDLGCVVYVEFRRGSLAIERDFHFIDDELRSRFIEERDQKMRLVEEEIDPGVPARCYERCRYLSFCGASSGKGRRARSLAAS